MADTESKAIVRLMVSVFLPAFSAISETSNPNRKHAMIQQDITLESMTMPIPKAFKASTNDHPAW